jgi:protoheme IX farnesyltransferase
LRGYAAVTAAATFALLVAGGLVTSTDSGLAVPDWPLSYGTWFPPMVGGIRYEHTHRMIAAVVGLMIVALAAWLWKAEPRRWVRWLGYAAAGGVVLQAFLGGLTVLLMLPPAVSIAHASLGPSVFVLTVLVAAATSGPEGIPLFVASRAVHRWSLLAALAAAAQLLFGAVLRHTGRGLALHVAGAALLALAAAGCWRSVGRQRAASGVLCAGTHRLLGLLIAQLALGALAWWRRDQALITTAHMALGSLLLAQAVWLAHRAWRAAWRPPVLWARALMYLELTKPRVTALVLVTTAAGFWLGLRAGAPWGTLAPLLLGTGLCAGGANALNQWMERGTDAAMERTRHRPIPSGRLAPEAARSFGAALVTAGVATLALAVNGVAALLGGLTVAAYLGVYTPLKRRTPLCTLAGAVPGALPPLIGWAGAGQPLGPPAWALFALLFLWQVPHFLAIAVLYRDDYTRAGLRMLPVLEPEGLSTARHIALSGLVLVPVSLFPASVGLAGSLYFYGALVLGLGFLAVALRAALLRSAPACHRLFTASVLYLPVLLGLMAWDKRVG